METLHQFTLKTITGKDLPLENFKGKKMLIVNTASECGYTPQYLPLQELHEKFGNRLVVLGVPSNDFGAQEPGDEKTIKEFCERNFGVTFPLSAKEKVTGKDAHPLFKWLSSQKSGGPPEWNFSKYLADESGQLIAKFPASMHPLDDEIIRHL